MVSDSGESDCSQMSLASQVSTGSAKLRAYKRTRTAAATVQATPEVSGSDRAIIERLQTENANLRSQIASLSEKVEKLTVQLAQVCRQDEEQAGPSAAIAVNGPGEPVAAIGLTPEAEARLRRSIAIEVGGMMDAKLAALAIRLPPEKPLRPPLAADAKKAEGSPSVAQTQSKGKGKGKKSKGMAAAPVVELPAVPAASTQGLQATPLATSEVWSTVVGRKAKAIQSGTGTGAIPAQSASSTPAKGKKKVVKLPRVPTTAAITLSTREGSSATLAEVLIAARQRVCVNDLGIDTLTQRRAADGGLVLLVGGTDSSTKADSLASRMREVLAEFDVQITRPTKMAEARIMDLDDAVTTEDVAAAIAVAAGCSPGDVKVGEIRRPPASLGHVWIRGPLAAIKKLASDKHIRLGWTSVRVEVLEARRMMCFRCLEPGHVRRKCTSSVDRSTQCYACGGDHKARDCTSAIVRCPLCADQGRPSDHRLGGKKCAPRKKQASFKPATTQRSAPAPLGAGPPEEMETSPSQP